MIGFPAPFRGADLLGGIDRGGSWPSAHLKKDLTALRELTNTFKESNFVSDEVTQFGKINESGSPWPELGRIRIVAFAFDASIATKGNAKGRVPRRKDR